MSLPLTTFKQDNEKCGVQTLKLTNSSVFFSVQSFDYAHKIFLKIGKQSQSCLWRDCTTIDQVGMTITGEVPADFIEL